MAGDARRKVSIWHISGWCAPGGGRRLDGMQRATWLLLGGTLTACFGGQTGEITMLGACREPIGEVSVDAASAAGRSAREQVDLLRTEASAPLLVEGSSATVDVGFALGGGPAVLLGGPECERPLLRAPVVVSLASDDGSLAETMEGAILLDDSGHGAVQAVADALEGSLELGGGSLTVDLLGSAASLEGHATIHDAATERVLATF